MGAKLKDEEEKWTLLDPPVEFTIEHTRSKAVKTLLADSKWRGVVRAKWGSIDGDVEFRISTGEGLREARDWRLTLDSIRLLKGDPDYEPRQPKPPRLPRVRPIKIDARQEDWLTREGVK